MHILHLMNIQLAESIEDMNICENMNKFDRLCHASRINIIPEYREIISGIYSVNVAIECLHDGVGNGIWTKSISYDNTTLINDKYVNDYYQYAVHEKQILIKIAWEEMEMVRRLIETNMHKYERMIKNTGEMDIYSLDQACADIDKTIGYIQKIIIIMIPSLVQKIDEFQRKKLTRRIAIQNFLKKNAIKYTKSDNTKTTIASQDFGGKKYSKNIRVTIQILQLCQKALEGISTAKIAG